MIMNWFTQFSCRRTSTRNTEHSGHSNEVIIPKTIHDFSDWRLKVHGIIVAVGISHVAEKSILVDQLCLRRLSARIGVPTLKEYVMLFNRNAIEL